MARRVIYETRSIEVSKRKRATDTTAEQLLTERYTVTVEIDVDSLFNQHAGRACRSTRHRSTVSGSAVVFRAKLIASEQPAAAAASA